MASLDIYERVMEESDDFHSFTAFGAGEWIYLVDLFNPQIEQLSAQFLETGLFGGSGSWFRSRLWMTGIFCAPRDLAEKILQKIPSQFRNPVDKVAVEQDPKNCPITQYQIDIV